MPYGICLWMAEPSSKKERDDLIHLFDGGVILNSRYKFNGAESKLPCTERTRGVSGSKIWSATPKQL